MIKRQANSSVEILHSPSQKNTVCSSEESLSSFCKDFAKNYNKSCKAYQKKYGDMLIVPWERMHLVMR